MEEMPSPIVLHIPHSSTVIPADLRASFLGSDEELSRELLAMTDRYTDELFSLPGASTVRFPVSRLVVDPERFVDDDAEPMAARGMGVVYTRRSDGQPLRAPLAPKDRQNLIERFYLPHHTKLTAAVGRSLEAHGRCRIVDCHSFASRALPCDFDQSPSRPDICIGTDPFHTPAWLTARAVELLGPSGWTVAIDRPFSGALVPLEFYNRRPEVLSIMVELNRGLYMNEKTGERLPRFSAVAQEMERLVMGLADAAVGRREHP